MGSFLVAFAALSHQQLVGLALGAPGILWDARGRSQDVLGRLRGALWTSQGLLGGTFGQNLFADLWPCGFGLDLVSI